MRNFFMYIWQLPQNLLGLLLIYIYRPESQYYRSGVSVFVSSRMRGGISLGRYIILNRDATINVAHELGHCKQSQILGWLYLPTVGLISGLRAWLHFYKEGQYYNSWPENWADKLGGIRR